MELVLVVVVRVGLQQRELEHVGARQAEEEPIQQLARRSQEVVGGVEAHGEQRHERVHRVRRHVHDVEAAELAERRGCEQASVEQLLHVRLQV